MEKLVVINRGEFSFASPILYIFCSTCIGTCGSVYMFCLKVRRARVFHFSMLFTTIMEAYFMMPMEGTAASKVESSLPTKEITGNPRGLKDFLRAALLIIVYSSTFSFVVLAPESR